MYITIKNKEQVRDKTLELINSSCYKSQSVSDNINYKYNQLIIQTKQDFLHKIRLIFNYRDPVHFLGAN